MKFKSIYVQLQINIIKSKSQKYNKIKIMTVWNAVVLGERKHSKRTARKTYYFKSAYTASYIRIVYIFCFKGLDTTK